MKITLTNEQFQEIRSDVVKEIKGDFKDVLTEILEDEYDVYSEISEHIHSMLEDTLANDMDKVIEKLNKEKLVKTVADLLMDKLINRW